MPTFASGGTQRDGDMMGVIVEINAAYVGFFLLYSYLGLERLNFLVSVEMVRSLEETWWPEDCKTC